MATPVPCTGKHGRFTVGGLAVPCKSFSIDIRGQPVETTSGEDGGYETYTGGVAGADLEADLWYDIANSVVAMVAPNGTYVIVLYPVLTLTGQAFTGTVFISNARVISSVHDQIIIRVTGKANGAFSIGSM